MAQIIASGSKKISQLTSVTGVSGSTSMPIVMGGETVQVSHTNFLNSTVFDKVNTYTQPNTFNGVTTFNDDVLVSGNLTAETIIVQLVSSSVVYSSGSNIFGSASNNTHQFTGSVSISGNLNVPSITASLSYDNITDKPTLVSGSSQVSFDGIVDKPTLFSSSIQVDADTITNFDTNVLTYIDSVGVVSSSQQINYGDISNIPNDIVSSSIQVKQFLPSGSVSSSQQVLDYSLFALTASQNTFYDTQTVIGDVTITGSLSISSSIEQGYNVSATGKFSRAYGVLSTASADYSYAEGGLIFNDVEFPGGQALEIGAHAAGALTKATGLGSYAAGFDTEARGQSSHTEGQSTLAIGTAAHAEGYFTTASGDYSHTEGYGTISSGDYQHVGGKWNRTSNINSAFIIGNGSSDTNRSNLIFAGGTEVQITGSLIVSSSSTFKNIGRGEFTGSVGIGGTTDISGSLLVNGLLYPNGDNGEESFIQTDGNGSLSLQYVKTLYETVYNGEEVTIAKGTPVYVSGSQGAASKVFIADAGNPNKMPVIYIVADNIPSATEGRGIALGLISGVDTTGYPAGTEIYVGVGGGWTSIRPTGSAIVQSLGIVTKEGNGGQGVVLNPGPNNLPNLNSGSIWVGNGNGLPVQTSTASLFGGFAITGSNTFVGNQTISGSLSVSGSGYFVSSVTASAFSGAFFGDGSGITGVTAGDVEFANILSKPTLVSGSSQISFNGIVDKPTLVSGSSQISFNGIVDKPTLVSGSSQITYSDISNIPNSIVSSSQQVLDYDIFATTGSNTFRGNQIISGSVNISGSINSTGNSTFGRNDASRQQFIGSITVGPAFEVGSPLIPNTASFFSIAVGASNKVENYSIAVGEVLYSPPAQSNNALFGAFHSASNTAQTIVGIASKIEDAGVGAFVVGNGSGPEDRSNLLVAQGTTVQITGSLSVTGSLDVNSDVKIENGYVVLTRVSQSLEFANDADAAAGNVPLGGLYRSGNFILIRLV